MQCSIFGRHDGKLSVILLYLYWFCKVCFLGSLLKKILKFLEQLKGNNSVWIPRLFCLSRHNVNIKNTILLLYFIINDFLLYNLWSNKKINVIIPFLYKINKLKNIFDHVTFAIFCFRWNPPVFKRCNLSVVFYGILLLCHC